MSKIFLLVHYLKIDLRICCPNKLLSALYYKPTICMRLSHSNNEGYITFQILNGINNLKNLKCKMEVLS